MVDYVICQPEIFSLFNGFEVNDPSLYSDHSMICFSLKCENLNNVGIHHVPSVSKTYKWKSEYTDDFIRTLGNDVTTGKLNVIANSLTDNCNQEKIETAVNDFSKVLCEIADPFFAKHYISPTLKGSTH